MAEQVTRSDPSRLIRGLNESQVRAVQTVDGPVLVVAGPGSGKTRVLTHRIAWLLEQCQVLPDQILAVTFTNKAAREMRERIERLAGDEINGLWMGTFHSFGVRLLRQNPGVVADRLGIQPNFLVYDDADQQAIVKRAITAAGLDPRQLVPRRASSRISAAKNQLLSPKEFAEQVQSHDDETISRVYEQYARLLRQANALDFDDLLRLPIELFDRAPQVLERYQTQFRHILVDEYQDTNRVQYVMVTELANRWRNLFVVGDPDQSIYAWRQADIRNILDFQVDYPDATRIDLDVNYRSTARIVAVADAVIRENKQRLDRKLSTTNPEGEPIALRELADQNHEAQFVVAEIRRLMQSQGVRPDEVAVMYRTTAQSRVLEEAFRVSDVPYRVVGGVKFYERKEVKDVIAVLRVIHNASDMVSLERIIGSFAIGKGLGPKAIDTIRAWSTTWVRPMSDGFVALAQPLDDPEIPAPAISGAAQKAGAKVGSAIARLREVARTATMSELFDQVVEVTGYRSAFDGSVEEEMQRWANVLELRTDLSRYDAIEDPGDALAQYLEQVALVADVDSMSEDGQGQVTLITLHSAKGLEFPVVFIVGIEEGLLPISRAVEAEFQDPLPMEEERRLFYVGITRAQRMLFLTYASSRQMWGRFNAGVASRFIDSIPQSALSTVTRSYPRFGGGKGSLRDRVNGQSNRLGGHGSGAGRWDGSMPGEGSPVRTSPQDDFAGRTIGSGAGREEPAPAKRTQTYSAGQKVFHNKFGEGQVLSVEARRDDQEVVVEFGRHGTKRLMASLAPLDIVG
ncbi:MAG TPA: UvrD-helicase domain-containing protein [Thermomicrobiales bacterium]|nr:UvrD-helicase domain-containing protein [Thermomicrobiales bacterium]